MRSVTNISTSLYTALLSFVFLLFGHNMSLFDSGICFLINTRFYLTIATFNFQLHHLARDQTQLKNVVTCEGISCQCLVRFILKRELSFSNEYTKLHIRKLLILKIPNKLQVGLVIQKIRSTINIQGNIVNINAYY